VPKGEVASGVKARNDSEGMPPVEGEQQATESKKKPKKQDSTPAAQRRSLSAEQQATLDRDRLVMRGDPAEGDPEDVGAIDDDGKPKRKEKPFFEYNGQKFKTSEELEDYLDDLETKPRSRRQPVEAEPQERKPKQKKDPFEGMDWDSVLVKPEGFFKDFSKRLVESIRGEIVPELTGAYQADTAVKEFWRDFYGEYPHLGKSTRLKKVVEGIFMDNIDSLGDLPVSKARPRLAKVAERELKALGIKFEKEEVGEEESPKQVVQRHRTQVESGEAPARSTRRVEGREEERRAPTLTELIKARRQRRLGHGAEAA
jgi:hypothetical protein